MRTTAFSLSPIQRLPTPVLVAVFCLLWSSAFAVAKIALADCPPLLLLSTRFLLAGTLMLGAAMLQRAAWDLSGRDLAVLAVLGIANNALYLGLGYMGMRSVSAGLATLIISANPVLTALLAGLVLNEQLTWRKLGGLVLGVGGVAFIVQSRLAIGTDAMSGIVFTIASLCALVGGTILFKLLVPKGGLWIGNGVQNLAGGLALAPVALAFESIGEVTPTWQLATSLAYMVLLVSVIGYMIWFHLLTVSGATAASAYHFLMPPLGMFFGWLLLSEHVTLRDLLGILPVALGIYLVTRPARQSTASAVTIPAVPALETCKSIR